MARPIKLNIKPDYNFSLIGIVTAEPVYRISWIINNSIGIMLKETSSLRIYNKKKQVVQEYSVYKYESETQQYHLIENKGVHGLFTEEQKQIDYWLKIEDTATNTDVILAKIKAEDDVIMAAIFEPVKMKSKARFIFQSE